MDAKYLWLLNFAVSKFRGLTWWCKICNNESSSRLKVKLWHLSFVQVCGIRFWSQWPRREMSPALLNCSPST